MNAPKMPPTLMLVLALVLSMTAVSCGRSGSNEDAAAAAAAATETGASRDEQAGEHAAGEEPSDLDQPVDELVARTCEHRKKTFECGECRYEVGVVCAPAALMAGGLLTTAMPAHERVAVPIALTGEIRFDERRVGHVSSQVEGIVKQVHVALGDAVRKGQPLVEIESVVAGEGQAVYLEAQGLVVLARRNFERMSELRRENIASEKEFLHAKQELEAAEIRAAGALGKLDRLGTDAGGGRVVLRAPMTGAVLVMHAVSGEVAKTDEPLVTVGDNTAVWVWADLYERDIAAVRQAQKAHRLAAAVAVKAYPGEDFPGVVSLVSPAMDEASRTVKVRIEVDNTDGRLLSGMFASVKLFLPGTEEALVVPRRAVLEDEGRSFVFVHYQGDYWIRRPVTCGRTWNEWAEITAGLDSSQAVVAEGAFLLKSDVLRSKMGAGCAD